jgi:outer membrane protein OmpA-like peptidoglycan-associated protein
VEFRLSRRFTLDIPVNYNPWTFSGGRKLKHRLVQPELRYWNRQAFRGSFWGIHTHVAQYNVSRIFSDYQFEGWLAGAGVSYGYRWNLSDRWGMEASIGAGYAYLDYDRYDASVGNCNGCGTKLGSDKKHYFGVTRAAVSLLYTLGKEPRKRATRKVMDIQPIPPRRIDTVKVVEAVVKIDTVYVSNPAPVVRYENGQACIHYPVNSAVLNPELAQNQTELFKIEQSMRNVRSASQARITLITIDAYSSPEGNATHNNVLAELRAETLKEYMAHTYGLDDALFVIRSGGENWKGLSEAIAASTHFTDEEKSELRQILEIAEPDSRKRSLQAYGQGKAYRWLLREVFPTLRVSSYRIDYVVTELLEK